MEELIKAKKVHPDNITIKAVEILEGIGKGEKCGSEKYIET
jgi:hypothetical protein